MARDFIYCNGNYIGGIWIQGDFFFFLDMKKYFVIRKITFRNTTLFAFESRKSRFCNCILGSCNIYNFELEGFKFHNLNLIILVLRV